MSSSVKRPTRVSARLQAKRDHEAAKTLAAFSAAAATTQAAQIVLVSTNPVPPLPPPPPPPATSNTSDALSAPPRRRRGRPLGSRSKSMPQVPSPAPSSSNDTPCPFVDDSSEDDTARSAATAITAAATASSPASMGSSCVNPDPDSESSTTTTTKTTTAPGSRKRKRRMTAIAAPPEAVASSPSTNSGTQDGQLQEKQEEENEEETARGGRGKKNKKMQSTVEEAQVTPRTLRATTTAKKLADRERRGKAQALKANNGALNTSRPEEKRLEPDRVDYRSEEQGQVHEEVESPDMSNAEPEVFDKISPRLGKDNPLETISHPHHQNEEKREADEHLLAEMAFECALNAALEQIPDARDSEDEENVSHLLEGEEETYMKKVQPLTRREKEGIKGFSYFIRHCRQTGSISLEKGTALTEDIQGQRLVSTFRHAPASQTTHSSTSTRKMSLRKKP